MPTVIQEEAATFTFDDDWQVLKFDAPGGFFDTRLRRLQVTKGIDIVGVYRNNQLYFIEIKDYRGGVVDLRQEERMYPGDKFPLQMARKVKDTVSGVVGAHRTTGAAIWPPCAALLANRHSILRCVFWIECDPLPNDAGMPEPRRVKRLRQRFNTLRQQIQQNLSWLTEAVTVVNRHTGPAPIPGLTVAFA